MNKHLPLAAWHAVLYLASSVSAPADFTDTLVADLTIPVGGGEIDTPGVGKFIDGTYLGACIDDVVVSEQ